MEFTQLILQMAQENAKHIAILNDETGQLAADIREIRTDVSWLMRFFWLIAATFITSVWTLYKTHKNNKGGK